MSDDQVYPLKWLTVSDGVVTEHEREKTYSSNWEKAFGAPYVPAARIEQLERHYERLREEAREVLDDLISVQNGPPLVTYADDWQEAYDAAVDLRDRLAAPTQGATL